jgi:hypothetical protein
MIHHQPDRRSALVPHECRTRVSRTRTRTNLCHAQARRSLVALMSAGTLLLAAGIARPASAQDRVALAPCYVHYGSMNLYIANNTLQSCARIIQAAAPSRIGVGTWGGAVVQVDPNSGVYINGRHIGTSAPQAAGRTPASATTFHVYCAAESICGKRGAEALPGNWSWTGQLFADIKRAYPATYCNLYPGSCAQR